MSRQNDHFWQINDQKLFELVSTNGDQTPQTAREIVSFISNYVRGLGVSQFEIDNELGMLHGHEPVLYMSDKRYRDHVKHACRIAVLGDVLLSSTIVNSDAGNRTEMRLITLVEDLMKMNPRYSGIFKAQKRWPEGDELDKFVLRTWYVAALLHDIGYAFEAYLQTAKNIKFFKKYKGLDDFFRSMEEGVSKLRDNLGCPELATDVQSSSKNIDHGRIGAMYVRSLLGDSDPMLVLASHIIYLHHFDTQIEFTEDPLAFLLVLLDETQEWGRQIVDRAAILDAFEPRPPEASPPSIELSQISMQSDIENGYIWDLGIHRGQLLFRFLLDYDDDSFALTKTEFNFPLALYLKEIALSRLAEGSPEKLQKILKDRLSVPAAKLDIRVDFESVNSLSQEWDRQARHLYAFADQKKNEALKEWAVSLIRKPGFNFMHKRLSMEVLNMEAPAKALYDQMKESFALYMLDREIQDVEVFEWIKYKRDKDPNFVNATFTVRRVWRNGTEPSRGIPQSYVTLGDIHPEEVQDALHYVRVSKENSPKLDRRDAKDRVIPVLLPKSKEPLVDQLALVFPFRKLTGTDLTREITVEYEFHLRLPITDLDADTYTNMRRRSTQKACVEVRFDKEFFEGKFIGGVHRRAKFPNWSDSENANFLRRIQRRLVSGSPPEEYVPIEKAKVTKNEIIFLREFTDVQTYQTVGWVWVPKKH